MSISKNMKILMPYICRSNHDIHSSVITGGIEKFGKNVYQMFSDQIIPVKITKQDRKEKKTKKIYSEAIDRYQPDMILLNDIDSLFFQPQIKLNIPTISIIHEPLLRDIRYLQMFQTLIDFTESGGHLYFVSELQQKHFQDNIKRVTGKELTDIKGHVNSSFATGNEKPSNEILYDAVTVGRNDPSKNPFLLHKKLQKSNLKTCVITSEEMDTTKDEYLKYYEVNSKWSEPNYTFKGLKYDDTMDIVSKSSCFISTFPNESFGITALEALCHGTPIILLTDKSGNHASECIPASPEHYRKVHKTIEPIELEKIVIEFSSLTYEQRLEISDMTKEKHNKILYKKQFDKMFSDRLQNNTKKTGIEKFF